MSNYFGTSASSTEAQKGINAGLIFLDTIPLGALSGTDEKRILVTPPAVNMPDDANLVIDKILFVTETGISKAASNFWTFQITNLTDTLDLLSAVVTTEDITAGVAISADVPLVITPNQNNTIGAGKVLEFVATKASSATTMNECSVTILGHWQIR